MREYGVTLVAHHLWHQLGLDELLGGLPQSRSAPVSEAVFRMVVNRLCDPASKLGLVDRTDERGNLHRGWQGQVKWRLPWSSRAPLARPSSRGTSPLI